MESSFLLAWCGNKHPDNDGSGTLSASCTSTADATLPASHIQNLRLVPEDFPLFNHGLFEEAWGAVPVLTSGASTTVDCPSIHCAFQHDTLARLAPSSETGAAGSSLVASEPTTCTTSGPAVPTPWQSLVHTLLEEGLPQEHCTLQQPLMHHQAPVDAGQSVRDSPQQHSGTEAMWQSAGQLLKLPERLLGVGEKRRLLMEAFGVGQVSEAKGWTQEAGTWQDNDVPLPGHAALTHTPSTDAFQPQQPAWSDHGALQLQTPQPQLSARCQLPCACEGCHVASAKGRSSGAGPAGLLVDVVDPRKGEMCKGQGLPGLEYQSTAAAGRHPTSAGHLPTIAWKAPVGADKAVSWGPYSTGSLPGGVKQRRSPTGQCDPEDNGEAHFWSAGLEAGVADRSMVGRTEAAQSTASRQGAPELEPRSRWVSIQKGRKHGVNPKSVWAKELVTSAMVKKELEENEVSLGKVGPVASKQGSRVGHLNSGENYLDSGRSVIDPGRGSPLPAREIPPWSLSQEMQSGVSQQAKEDTQGAAAGNAGHASVGIVEFGPHEGEREDLVKNGTPALVGRGIQHCPSHCVGEGEGCTRAEGNKRKTRGGLGRLGKAPRLEKGVPRAQWSRAMLIQQKSGDETAT